jgi:Calx-beta domain-containing protein
MLRTGSVGNYLHGRPLSYLSLAFLAALTLALVVAMPADAAKRHHRKAAAKTKSFSFSALSYDANETDGSALITVTRSPSHGPASVHVATSDGTAIAGTDYVAVSTTLSFKSGQTSKTISVSILDDQAAGEDPTATVNLGLDSPSKGYAAGPSAVLNIHEDAAPSAPANLQVTGTDPYDVSLGWDPSAGATGYAIYRSTTSGSGYAQIGTTAGTTFTDSGVGASTYYYVVQATNDDGNSDNSSQVSGAASGTNLLSNGNFETGDFSSWTTGTSGSCVGPCFNRHGVLPSPSIDSGTALGSYSAFLGQPTSCIGDGSGQAFIYQSLTVPATGTTTLTWYYNGQADDSLGFDGQQVLIENSTGSVLATAQSTEDNSRIWTRRTYDLTSLAGTGIRVLFRVYGDGSDTNSCSGMNVDNVSVTNG